MSGDRIVSLHNPWFTASVGITAAIAIIAAVAGFAWLPLQQQGERFDGIWDAICSAAGLVRNAPSASQIVDTPNLAGEYPITIYKELVDFKTSARASAVMAPLVADLRDADMRDLAAYYAYLPRPPDLRATSDVPPRIVANGAPMRGIAPCGACHGELDSKPGAAWLEGQPAIYLRTQLAAFASGARRNDIGEQMRNIARRMTPDEIAAASRFYADRP